MEGDGEQMRLKNCPPAATQCLSARGRGQHLIRTRFGQPAGQKSAWAWSGGEERGQGLQVLHQPAGAASPTHDQCAASSGSSCRCCVRLALWSAPCWPWWRATGGALACATRCEMHAGRLTRHSGKTLDPTVLVGGPSSCVCCWLRTPTHSPLLLDAPACKRTQPPRATRHAPPRHA